LPFCFFYFQQPNCFLVIFNEPVVFLQSPIFLPSCFLSQAWHFPANYWLSLPFCWFRDVLCWFGFNLCSSLFPEFQVWFNTSLNFLSFSFSGCDAFLAPHSMLVLISWVYSYWFFFN
jgi:hypothetical protein